MKYTEEDWIEIPQKEIDYLEESFKFKANTPYRIDKIEGQFILKLSGHHCHLSFSRDFKIINQINYEIY